MYSLHHCPCGQVHCTQSLACILVLDMVRHHSSGMPVVSADEIGFSSAPMLSHVSEHCIDSQHRDCSTQQQQQISSYVCHSRNFCGAPFGDCFQPQPLYFHNHIGRATVLCSSPYSQHVQRLQARHSGSRFRRSVLPQQNAPLNDGPLLTRLVGRSSFKGALCSQFVCDCVVQKNKAPQRPT